MPITEKDIPITIVGNGTTTPSGTLHVVQDADVTITATPGEGAAFDNFFIDDTYAEGFLSSDNPLTFTGAMKYTAVTATFKDSITIVEGFGGVPAGDVTINETGHRITDSAAIEAEDGIYSALTPEEVQAVIDAHPGLAWDTNAQYIYYKSSGEHFAPEEQNGLGIWLDNAATDGTNTYNVYIGYSAYFDVPDTYTCDIIPIFRITADGHFEVMGGRVYTDAQGVQYLGIIARIGIALYDLEGEPIYDKSFQMVLNDLDTADKYAEANGDPDTYGNNYHGAEGHLWPHQEAWGIEIINEPDVENPDTVYVGKSTWLVSALGQSPFDEGQDVFSLGNGHSTDCDGDECSMVYLAVGGTSGVFTTSAGSLRLFGSLASANPTYTITASAEEGGSISDPGATTVEEGGCMTYTFTPDEGKKVGAIIVDGQIVGYNADSYEFCPVHADHTIVVTFADDALADCSDEAPTIEAIPVDPYTGSEEFVDELPESGEENTIYYVTNGDGYDIYYWDGTSFVKIA